MLLASGSSLLMLMWLSFLWCEMPIVSWQFATDVQSVTIVDNNVKITAADNPMLSLNLWSDEFGSVLDTGRWAENRVLALGTEEGTVTESANKVRIEQTTSVTTGWRRKGIVSQRSAKQTGNFSVEASVEIISATWVGDWWQAMLVAGRESGTSNEVSRDPADRENLQILRGRTGAGTEVIAAQWSDLADVQYVDYNISATLCQLRLRRDGATVYLDYDIGTGWVTLLTTSRPNFLNDPWLVGFHNALRNPDNALTTDWDYFHQTTGSIYWDDAPEAILIEKDSRGYSSWDMSSFLATEGGTGAVKYQYSAHNTSGVPSYNGIWLSKEQLQAAPDPTGRYFQLKVQFLSDGTQSVTLDEVSIAYAPTIARNLPSARRLRAPRNLAVLR